MQLLSIVASAFFAAVAHADAAPKSRDSPRNAVYTAKFDRGISGNVRFFVHNGYVRVAVDLKGLPRQGGPFMYHVHEKKVASPGDCASTMGHFNPYNGVLNARTWALAEVGDLSGKHGLIPGTSYKKTYYDPYMSLNPRNKAFFGDLSVVVHLNDGTRIACTDIVRERGGPASLVTGDEEGGKIGEELGGVGGEKASNNTNYEIDLSGTTVAQSDEVDIDLGDDQNDLDTSAVEYSGEVDIGTDPEENAYNDTVEIEARDHDDDHDEDYDDEDYDDEDYDDEDYDEEDHDDEDHDDEDHDDEFDLDFGDNFPFGGKNPFGGNFPFDDEDDHEDDEAQNFVTREYDEDDYDDEDVHDDELDVDFGDDFPFGGKSPFGGNFPFDDEDDHDDEEALSFVTRSEDAGEEPTRTVPDGRVGVSMPLAIGRRAVHV